MSFHQYFNGHIFPVDQPLFKSSDLGLLRGYGIFDYFRTYNGKPFRWNDYWDRFRNSAALLHLPLPVDQEEVTGIMDELYRLSSLKEVAYRFVLTGGYSLDSVSVTAPNLLIRAEAVSQDNPAIRAAGIKVLPFEYVRDIPEIKSTHYVHMIRMAEEMKRRNATDLLYHKHGEVSELTRSNVFIVKGNSIITPDKDMLHGITRRVVLELAAEDFDIQVRPVTLHELLEADEVFTTSSTKMVLGIVAIDTLKIGDGKPGECTRILQERFEQLIRHWGR